MSLNSRKITIKTDSKFYDYGIKINFILIVFNFLMNYTMIINKNDWLTFCYMRVKNFDTLLCTHDVAKNEMSIDILIFIIMQLKISTLFASTVRIDLRKDLLDNDELQVIIKPNPCSLHYETWFMHDGASIDHTANVSAFHYGK